MSVENHLKESILRTALFHLLKNQKKSPDRAARNILEVLLHYNPSGQAAAFQYEELRKVIASCPKEECVNWIMNHIL